MNSRGTGAGGIIVICGIDGSGKTLQSKKLYARLKQHDVPAQYVEFPRYSEGFFGELIARYLRGEMAGGGREVSPYLSALPFACDRWEFSYRLRDWMDSGEVIVCNRYVTANMAHQGGKIKGKCEREEFYRWVEKMEYEVFAIPEPRMHIWLDITPEHAMELVGKKEERSYLKGCGDIHENHQHLRIARDAYAELAGRMENWVTIECSTGAGPVPADDVARLIWGRVAKLLQISEE